MSDTVASLVLKVDSSQVATGVTALNGLNTAAKTTAPAIAALTAATAPAGAAMATMATASHTAGAAHSGLSTQAMAAMHSVRSLTESVLAGASPVQALAQQFGHLSYAASGPGGVVGSFKEAGSVILGAVSSILSPVVLITTGIAALGTGAAIAFARWEDSQRAAQLGLVGIGQASQVTLGQINKIADATGSLSGISTLQAREVATALAATGKIGGDNIALLTANAKDFASALGLDVPHATELLAKAISNPTAGAKELGDRLGGVDAATMKLIENLQTQGNLQGAINVLINTFVPNVLHATDLTSTWAKAWNLVTNAASNTFDAIGKGLSRTTLGMSEDQLQTQRSQLESQISSLQSGKSNNRNSDQVNGLVSQLFAINEALMKVQDSAKKAADEADKLKSLQLAPVFNQFLPEVGAKQNLTNTATAISGAAGDSNLINKLGLTPDQAARAKAIIDDLAGHFKTAFDAIQTQNLIASQSITAFSPGAKATIAQLQTIENLRTRTDLSPEEKATSAQNAYNLSLKGTLTGLSEVARERQLTANLETDAARVQVTAIGASVGETYKLQAVEQARATLVQEAARNRTAFDSSAFAGLQKQINLTAQLKQIEAERKAQSDQSFATSQLGRTDQEQQVATALRQLYGDDFLSHQNDAIANQIRFNDTLLGTKNTAQDALGGFVKDLVAGKSAAEAFQGALSKIESKLIDMATNALIANLMKTIIGAGFGGGVTAGNDPFGASGLFGSHHTGGIVGSESGPSRSLPLSTFIGAPKFHGGGLVSGDVPVVAQAGEGIFTRAQMAAMQPAGGGPAPVQIVNVHNYSDQSAKTTKRTGSNGASVTDVIIGVVGTHMAQGGFDSQLSARTNTKKQPFGR